MVFQTCALFYFTRPGTLARLVFKPTAERVHLPFAARSPLTLLNHRLALVRGHRFALVRQLVLAQQPHAIPALSLSLSLSPHDRLDDAHSFVEPGFREQTPDSTDERVKACGPERGSRGGKTVGALQAN